MKLRKREFIEFAFLFALIPFTCSASAEDFPLKLTNNKSGISVSLSGENGKDWAVERTIHDDKTARQILFLKSSVAISLAHNERNTIMKNCKKIPRRVGINGADKKPNSGDEGTIHFKIDRDGQAHGYHGLQGKSPHYAPRFEAPFCFKDLTYDGKKAVLGSVGNNGGAFGGSPTRTGAHFAYGQKDGFGNEWHTLTYWDDDILVYQKAKESPHRQSASDGHCVAVCVDPKTPIIQFKSAGKAQFYTTPVKTYHVPKIWKQTTFLTADVRLHFVNITNNKPIEYRVGDGAFTKYGGEPLRAGDLVTKPKAPVVLEVRAGAEGAALQRTLVLDPDYPAPKEKHGFILWPDDEALKKLRHKLAAVEPFKTSWRTFSPPTSYYQSTATRFGVTRGGWRSTASSASKSFNTALVATVNGPAKALEQAKSTKARLLHMFRLMPVGFELNVNSPSPSKDYFNELSQTMQLFADAAIAYDLLISVFRASDHPDGITPIEERIIRDGLAQVSKCMLQFRDNYSNTHGGGDTHWAHGYEIAIGIAALCMPTYKTPYYGVSGGDRITKNDLKDENGKYYNPFPDQGVTWYEAVTNPHIERKGYPNVARPLRAEFLITDDGYWTGPNDLLGDGTRYHTGPIRNSLVDVKYGGISNAECRVELVELHGYETPFVTRNYAWYQARKLRGDKALQPGNEMYLRRRLVGGVVRLRWDKKRKVYVAGRPSVNSAIFGFNPVNAYAGLPTPRKRVAAFLDALTSYFRKKGKDPGRKTFFNPYALVLCAAPDEVPAVTPEALGENNPPILKPLFKYVVRPGEAVLKHIVASDPDDQPITVEVKGLPDGATFDAKERRISWAPAEKDMGVHVVSITVSDGKLSVTKPFPIIIMPAKLPKKFPAPPKSLRAEPADDGKAVRLTWPAAAEDTAGYCIYRDGALHGYTTKTEWKDTYRILPRTHTRYEISTLNKLGRESRARSANPAVLSR